MASFYQLIPPSWRNALIPLLNAEYGDQIVENIHDDKNKGYAIFPPEGEWFAALHYTPLQQVRVVILGQDPYHGPGQANGLAFSVPKDQPLPPSLKNIFKELHTDLGDCRTSGDLSDWAQQGVLLLNTVLTVRAQQPNSHASLGWEGFTDAVLQAVQENNPLVVFVLWGNAAQRKKSLIDAGRHVVICSTHPSPLGAYRGFIGSKPFSTVNQYLMAHGQNPIRWGEQTDQLTYL